MKLVSICVSLFFFIDLTLNNLLLLFQLWEQRITAGCEQHDVKYHIFKEALSRTGVLLNKKTLADLACWEPYTFKSLADIAKQKAEEDGLNSMKPLEKFKRGFYTRAMLKR